MTPANPLLSAALITRDEQDHLPECLASLSRVVDEIVVVDTGSSDRTVDIARAHGAIVHEVAWQNDFAAARNVALDYARGKWILSIDADERLAPIDRAFLEPFLTDDAVAAYMVLLRPARAYTTYRECRLFRNVPTVRFEGRIHERVVPTLSAYAARERLRVGRCPLLLEHVGYEGPKETKARRDLPLLVEHLREFPSDLDHWRRLAEAAAVLGDAERARYAYESAVRLVRADNVDGAPASLTYAGFALWMLSADEDAEELIAEGRERFPSNHLLVWLSAQVEILRGNDDAAMTWYAKLTEVDVDGLAEGGISYDQRLFAETAYAGIAGCLFRLGRYDESAVAYARAAESAPQNLEFRAKNALAAARAARVAKDAVAA